MSEQRDHDPSGWWNVCTRRLADRHICGLTYWYAWVPSTRGGWRFTGKDSGIRHVCREVAG